MNLCKARKIEKKQCFIYCLWISQHNIHKKDYHINIKTLRYSHHLCLLVSFLFEPSDNCRPDPCHPSPTMTSSSCYDEQILPFVPSSRQLWRKNTCPITLHFLNTYHAIWICKNIITQFNALIFIHVISYYWVDLLWL